MTRWRRSGAWIAVAALAAVVALAGPAGADEPGESTVASELLRQAIALAVNTPDDLEAVREKMGDALEVDDRAGVDLDLVRQADDAVAAGDLPGARLLLERSIGARPQLSSNAVAPIDAGAHADAERAVGAEPGAAPILDPLEGSGLEGAGDWSVLVGAAALVVLGGYLALRWRPARGGAV